MEKQTKGGEKVGRQRSPDRDNAKELYIESRGKIKPKELAERFKVPVERIRKWKSVDEWEKRLKEKYPPQRGGQPGNTNAKGHGAPQRNQNAKTHGAYCNVFFDELTDQEKELKDSLTNNLNDNLMREYQALIIKENRLKKAINELDAASKDELFIDTVTEMVTPKSKEEKEEEKLQAAVDAAAEYYVEEAGVYISKAPRVGEKLHMRITNQSSAFNRQMKLEEALAKIHGRIIKILDTMRCYEIDQQRMSLDCEKLKFAKQRATGVFEVPLENGECDVLDEVDD